VKVMVLGATGFIGPPLMAALAAMGHDPLGVARRGGEGAPFPVVSLDRSDAAAVAALAERERVEAVVDLLAMTLAGTAPLLAALAGRVGRYAMASSGDVYRRYGALHRLEPDPDAGGPLTEDAPLRTRLHPYRAEPRRPADDPAAWMDDYDKIPIEGAAAAQTGLPAVAVRLPMVFGPGDRQRRFAWAIRPLLAKASAIELDAAWAAWRTTYGYVEDVAAGLALAATHPAAQGAYNLGLAEAPDHLGWAERFAAATGWTGELRTIPRAAVREPLRGQLDGLDLALPLVTDTGRTRAELGYDEPTEPSEALARTVADEARRAAQ